MAAWIGLCLAFVSALVVNWAYTREHGAASTLPPLSPRHPLASARLLLRARAWLTGFAAETGGWGLYVVALALAPLARRIGPAPPPRHCNTSRSTTRSMLRRRVDSTKLLARLRNQGGRRCEQRGPAA